MPVTGASNGVVLKDLRGLAYDDPKWDELLDEMTVADMDNLIALGGYQTYPVERIGKVTTFAPPISSTTSRASPPSVSRRK